VRPIPFEITDSHLLRVFRWARWHRRRYGDEIDYEDLGNHALYRAWATYRPGNARDHWHLEYHLRSALSNEITRRKRRAALLARRRYITPPESEEWWWFGLVDYLTDHGPAIPQHPKI
jgi:hypothetical protein